MQKRVQNPVESEKLECNMEHVTNLNMEHGMNLEVNQNSNHVGRMKDFDFSMYLYYNVVESFKKGGEKILSTGIWPYCK